MANRPSLITKRDATNVFEAAKDAGFGCVRVISTPDGRLEIVAEQGKPPHLDDDPNEWDEALK